MRAHEFILENYNSAGSLDSPERGPGLLEPERQAMPGVKTFPDIPSHYYDMYRFGMHMAGSPDGQKMEKRGAVGNQLVTLAYSDADADIVNKSAKAMNISIKALSSDGSEESKEINQTSPIAKPKRNRFGI